MVMGVVRAAIVAGMFRFLFQNGSSIKSSMSPGASNTWVKVSFPGASTTSFAKRCASPSVFQLTRTKSNAASPSIATSPEYFPLDVSLKTIAPATPSTATFTASPESVRNTFATMAFTGAEMAPSSGALPASSLGAAVRRTKINPEVTITTRIKNVRNSGEPLT